MGSLPLVVHAVVVCSVPLAGGTQADLFQRWPELRSLTTSNGAWFYRLLGTLLHRLRSIMMAAMTITISAKLNETISIVAMTKALTSYLSPCIPEPPP